MKIFVSGATGVLGRRAVRLLVEAGHDVSAVARSPEKAALVDSLGATSVPIDLFDAAAVETAVAGHEVVINLATHIPSPAKIWMLRAWRENDRLRREASRNLVDGAIAADSERYIQESIGCFYEDLGDAWIDESVPVELPGQALTTRDAEAQAARFTQAGGSAVVLRFGMFYCADSDQTQLQMKLARMRICPFFGAKDEYQSIIHVDDAASSVVAALDAPPGVYNITDDEPLTKGEASTILAEAVGRQRLVAIPRFLPGLGGSVVRALLRSQRVSNKSFRTATRWAPVYSSAREGLPAVVEKIRALENA